MMRESRSQPTGLLWGTGHSVPAQLMIMFVESNLFCYPSRAHPDASIAKDLYYNDTANRKAQKAENGVQVGDCLL